MADPFSLLESDHRQVEQLLHDLDESEEGPERAHASTGSRRRWRCTWSSKRRTSTH